MKLDRNKNENGKGKYALVLMREVPDGPEGKDIHEALNLLNHAGCLDYGTSPDQEFFVLRLKDAGASAALHAYAKFFFHTDPEWSDEVHELAEKSHNHPRKKMPD